MRKRIRADWLYELCYKLIHHIALLMTTSPSLELIFGSYPKPNHITSQRKT